MSEPTRHPANHEGQTPLLATKFFAPRARRGLVARPRLTQRLAEALEMPLTLVSAPAGCGKTTLLAGWRQSELGRDVPLAWVSLDRDDSDPVRFWAYVVAALQTVQSGFGQDLLALLHSSPPTPTPTVLALLVNELADVERDLVLALDDYHAVDSRPVHEAFVYLVEHLPPMLHLVVLTRMDPPWPLARWRARGVVSELRGADLRFSLAEAASFLREVARLELSPEDVSALETRTEGWIVGLQMAALSLRSRHDPSAFIRSFAGTDRYVLDFLAEEVLARQPEAVQRFLLVTSILERFSASLCDAVTSKTDGEAMLERLERDNLFVVPLDEGRQWYRYHHLFRELLQARLKHSQSDHPQPLYSRAANWCEARGYLSEAVGYALAGQDYPLAGRLVGAHSREVTLQGEVGVVLGWLRALPRDVVRSSAALAVSYCWALWLNGEVAALESQLEDALHALHRLEVGADEDGHEASDGQSLESLRAEVTALRTFLARAHGDLEGAVQLAEEARALAPGQAGFVGTVVVYALATAYHGVGNLDQAIPAYRETIRLARAERNPVAAIGTAFHLARVLHLRGRLREAAEVCREALRFAGSEGWEKLPACGLVHLALADVLRERDDLDSAEAHLAAGLELGRLGGQGDALKYHGIVGARIRRARGDVRGALQLVQDAEMELEKLDGWLRSAELADEQSRAWLALNDVLRAAEWADEAARRVGLDRHYPRERMAVASARVRLAEGGFQAAANLLGSALEALERSGQVGLLVEALVLNAQASWCLEAREEALAALRRALALAEPAGYRRVFLDEGQAIADLLRRSLERRAWASPAVARYAAGLASRLAGRSDDVPWDREAAGCQPITAPDAGLIEPLSERELEVLRLVAEGLPNPAIAARLIISVGTVKAHVHHIYGKLGVEGRVQAISRARQLKLL